MESALAEIKAELGQNAIILDTKRRRPLLGLFGRAEYEVTAAVDTTSAELRSQAAAVATLRQGNPVDDVVPVGTAAVFAATAPAPVLTHPAAVRPVAPLREQRWRKELADLGFEPETLERLGLDDPDLTLGRLRRRLADKLQPWLLGEPVIAAVRDKPRVITLVGPTGVGKSTTLAKLAAGSVQRGQASVALITLDTYRVGAADQLRAFADLLQLPCRVAHDGASLASAVGAMQDRDMIFIDTAGCAPGDQIMLGRLRLAMQHVRHHEIHLVLSAPLRLQDALRLAEDYRSLGADRLILTKLDETQAIGAMWEIPARLQLPLAYVTDGQTIPDDLEAVEAMKAAQRVIDRLRQNRGA